MKQRTLHLAVIMDGNGRWATRRGLPRVAGHHAGERALRRVVEAAPALGVSTLTAYAFSSDNWKRPPEEVRALMLLLENHMARCVQLSKEQGVRLSVIGRRDRIPSSAGDAIAHAEEETRCGTRLHLRLAIDYSSRDALVTACSHDGLNLDRSAISARLGVEEVDLLIRTGGEQRLSDFLLWECAYAELLFTPCLWPDFGPDELRAAVGQFHKRTRRFGGLDSPVPDALPLGRSVVESRK